MILDRVPAETVIRTDVCVIGAGPAGISLALTLTRDRDVSVTIIESGGATFDEEVQKLSRADVTGMPLASINEARIRALGGSTWSWGGICTTLNPITFERRPWVDGYWPFPKSELDRYLEAALRWTGIQPAMREPEVQEHHAFAGSGLDPAVLTPITFPFSRPVRFGTAYRPMLAERTGLTTYLHSTVTSLGFDGNRVTVARGSSRGSPFEVEARQYVLAAGGIENPRLLLVSGVDRDPVGRYFMEHPRVPARYAIKSGQTPLGRLIRGATHRRESVRVGLSPALQRQEQSLVWHADLRFGHVGQLSPAWDATRRLYVASRRPWNESPYFQDAGGGRLRRRPRDVAAVLRRPDQMVAGMVGAATRHPALRRYLEIWSCIEQAPDRENRVRLSDTLDPVGVPQATVHWSVGDAEARTYRIGLGHLLGQLERLEPGLAAAALESDDGWPDRILGTWHHIGTTRMHDDPAHGVVDRQGRVHGVSNLAIAGSSVFPVSGSESPTVTIIELALRLADHLRRELKAVPVVSLGAHASD
jgi:choline dehydrogenase-like flavoprotein